MTLGRTKYFVLTVSALCAGAVSGVFTLLGVRVSAGGLFSPVLPLPLFLWGEWGVLWGGFCGWFWGEKLFRELEQSPSLEAGLRYGVYAGLMIGTVNAALTGTLPFGFVLGLFLGPVFGASVAFLAVKLLARV
ncbi:MAG TPA: hypothetical protein PLB05_00290 [Candidatus Omnitrophota bacterium]|jgi:hypothetical protein|nr:hypothetical protein [Candidatus Omnitrophota bacterium]HPN55381.1 hypothetical protein [Candidatus Omnitrophota bacterium]